MIEVEADDMSAVLFSTMNHICPNGWRLKIKRFVVLDDFGKRIPELEVVVISK
jgi:hypothetical protein